MIMEFEERRYWRYIGTSLIGSKKIMLVSFCDGSWRGIHLFVAQEFGKKVLLVRIGGGVE